LALPCVVITQGTDINDYLGYPLRRGVILRHLGRAAAVVARSEALRRRLVEAGLPEGRVQTIHNGVDTDFFRPAVDRQAVRRAAGLGPADVAVLFVGNFAPVKDPLLAVRAVAVLRERFPDQAWRLFMLGDGPLRTRVKTAAGALGGQVTLAGVCSPAQVLRFMQAADVLCVPSRNEGIPNVIREALACGLPVAATRVGGVPEVLTDPRTGELVEPGRPVLMADALARVVARGPQGGACRRQALAFSWDETVRRYSELFAVLATPPP
jgi:glycosyltransferase involved in cell wall biosynthesis